MYTILVRACLYTDFLTVVTALINTFNHKEELNGLVWLCAISQSKFCFDFGGVCLCNNGAAGDQFDSCTLANQYLQAVYMYSYIPVATLAVQYKLSATMGSMCISVCASVSGYAQRIHLNTNIL